MKKNLIPRKLIIMNSVLGDLTRYMYVMSTNSIRNGFKIQCNLTRSAGEWALLPVPPYKSRGKEESSMKTKDLSLITVYAALYAAMVVVFSPISFAALQFRVAGVLRPGIARKRELAIAYAVGVVVANVFSPFAGIYELLFMPVMSGGDALTHIRKRDPKLPVVVTSGHSAEDADLPELSDKYTEYLQKPFDPEDLAVCLAQMLESGE